jgi:glycosyltransferase involved in cell wall biosynthesis
LNPLITIGITSYYAEKTISRAIESALNQSWENTEIIINDDNSKDETISILKDYKEKYKNIKLILNKDNSGVANSRNKIINAAQGEYLVFFDDDDYSDIDRVKLQYQRIIDYQEKWNVNNYIICHSARKVKYLDGETLIEKTMGCNNTKVAPNGESVALRILIGARLNDGYGSMATCSQMASLLTYKEIGGFDENLRRSEDTELNIRLALSKCHFLGISRPLVIQYLTASQDKNFEIEYESTLYYIKKYKSFINKHSSYSFIKSWIKIKFMFYRKQYLLGGVYLFALSIRYPFASIKRAYLSIPNIGRNLKFIENHTYYE